MGIRPPRCFRWLARARVAAAFSLPAGVGRSRRRYFEAPKEAWARSYAQTVLTRSDDPSLHAHLAGLLEVDDLFVWPTALFEPVADAVESTLDRLGLLCARPALVAA